MKYAAVLLFSSSVIGSLAFAGTPQAFSGGATGGAAAPAAPAAAPVSGKVLETMDAGTYTYIKMSTASGETWAAVPKAEIKKGSEVTIDNPMRMDGFESKSLKRKFDKIVFGTLGAGAPSGAGAAAMPPGHGMGAGMGNSLMGGKFAGTSGPHGAATAPVDLSAVKVPKASGADAKTVEEVYKEKAKLSGKKVTIRGKVVKVNMGIMNKNWVHLQDGSGSPDAANFDLIVTTKDAPKLGETVIAKGKVGTDRDLGAGYKYSVLVEDATITK